MSELPLLRTSERISFKQCRQKWDWEFNDLLKPRDTTPALKFGDLVHQALAAYYKKGRKRGPHPAKTFERLYEERREHEYAEGFRDEDGDWHEAGSLGVTMLERYVREYGERDKKYKVIASEQIFYVPLKVIIPGYGTVEFVYVGTVDGIWLDLDADDYLFAEHKTTKAINKDGLPLDEQAGAYWTYTPKWMLKNGIIQPHQVPKYILYNFLRKSVPNPAKTYDEDGRVLNKDGSISKQQPAPYWDRERVYRDKIDRERVHKRVLEEFTDMFLIRMGSPTHRVYKNPGPLHMPNCRGCPFRDMCELHETGNDWESFRDSAMETWDPYDAHERIERK